MHMKEQLDLVLCGTLEPIFNANIASDPVKGDSTPVENRVGQPPVTIVFSLNDYVFGFLFEPQ